jgi:hypothetical protein
MLKQVVLSIVLIFPSINLVYTLGNFNFLNINIYSENCVSGKMQVDEQTKGIVTVSQLSDGDVIRGISGAKQTSAWCKVTAVFLVARGQNRTTYDGFTADHMVMDKTVHQYGKRGEKHSGPVFTLATDCDAAVNSAGEVFTPISTTFCPHELTWSEYLPLIAAIRRITSRTGNFWFDLDAYHDNDTALVPRWLDQLPALCDELLRCARKGECQQFERVTEKFVHEHLNTKFVGVVDRAFPNLGGDIKKSEAGTISEVVWPQGRSFYTIVLCAAIGGFVLLLLVIVLAIVVYRSRVSKRMISAKGEPKQSSVDLPAEDVKA